VTAVTALPHSWFLRGYIAWKRHDLQQASAMLNATRNARGRDWKPAGSVLEGDVQHRMYSESGFLGIFEKQWDGSALTEIGYPNSAPAYNDMTGMLSLSLNPFEARLFTT
jgi:hypothetical protein